MPRRNLEIERKIMAAGEIDLARMAAFIDGEGCISIVRNKPRKSTYSPRHYISISVINTNPLLIAWLSSVFGGGVYQRKPEHKRLGKRPLWQWQINGSQACLILERCMPYFIIKKQQAEVGLAFELVKGGQRGRKVTDELLAKRDVLHSQMSALNFPGGRTPSAVM